MRPEVETQLAWLGSLTATARREFLARLAHGLTIGIRVLCHVDRDAQNNLESIRQVNEASHIVLGYLARPPTGIESSEWLLTIVRSVLSMNDETADQQASQAWSYATSSLDSAGVA